MLRRMRSFFCIGLASLILFSGCSGNGNEKQVIKGGYRETEINMPAGYQQSTYPVFLKDGRVIMVATRTFEEVQYENIIKEEAASKEATKVEVTKEEEKKEELTEEGEAASGDVKAKEGEAVSGEVKAEEGETASGEVKAEEGEVVSAGAETIAIDEKQRIE